MRHLRNISSNNAQSEEINITPLVDVIFILLIFFIVTMSFSDKNSLEVDVPTAKNNQKPTGEFIAIQIDKNGEISIDQQKCSLSILPAKIKALNKKDVTIFADKNVTAEKLVDVIDAVKSLKDTSIYLATQKK